MLAYSVIYEIHNIDKLIGPAIGGLQAFPEDLKDKSAAAIVVDGTKESKRS